MTKNSANAVAEDDNGRDDGSHECGGIKTGWPASRQHCTVYECNEDTQHHVLNELVHTRVKRPSDRNHNHVKVKVMH